ncbi:type III-B CRISPR module RAMP protein Cmr6 [Acidilobus sp.]|uniref:type III-B CRISPR module RAMP protein Cmr6 n=1 Tax=Acidilobus sp. TaxID=1872109 RepID=UPI003D0068B7
MNSVGGGSRRAGQPSSASGRNAKKEEGNLMISLIKLYRDSYLASLSGSKSSTAGGEGTDWKTRLKEEIIGHALTHDFKRNVDQANEYIDEVADALANAGLDVIDVKANVSTKLLSGFAAGFLAVMLEVGMNWDPILDLPYVPGSSIKGVMRSNLLDLCRSARASNPGDVERCARAVLTIFGSGDKFMEGKYLKLTNFKTRSHIGAIDVFNAYPVKLANGRLLDGDIVNAHYYRNNQLVKNEYEVVPNPVAHLVVRRGVMFRFLVGVNDLDNASELAYDIFGEEAKGKVKDGVGLALLSLAYALGRGVGARTSKGYGIFDIDVNGVSVRRHK